MTLVVADTSVLVAEPIPATAVDVAVGVSTVSLAEMQLGLVMAPSAKARAERLARLQRVRRQFTVLPLDEAVAEAYGDVAHGVRRTGRSHRPRAFDLLIAATAVAVGAGLLTRNAADLRGLENLLEIVEV